MVQIRCDQCGRMLAPREPTTVVCPSCGRANVIPSELIAGAFPQADDSATRPVPTSALASAGPEELAERPTSPPPPPRDPQTAPAGPYRGGYVPPSVPRSGGAPFAQADSGLPTPPRDATAVLPPGAGATGPADATSGRRGLGRWAIVSGTALLVVLLLGSGGVVLVANGTLGNVFGTGQSPTATTANTPTTAALPGFRQFASPDGEFQLKVPESWAAAQQTVSGVSLALFSDPATQANFEIEVVKSSADPASLDAQFINQVGPSLAGASGSSALTGTPAADTTPLAGILWTRQIADVTVTKGGQSVTWEVVALSAQRNQNTLLIAYFAPQAVFTTENATHFVPMLNSLTLR